MRNFHLFIGIFFVTNLAAQDYTNFDDALNFLNTQMYNMVQIDKYTGSVKQYNAFNKLNAEYNLKDIGVFSYGGQSPKLDSDTTNEEHHWFKAVCKNGKCIKKKRAIGKKWDQVDVINFDTDSKIKADNAINAFRYLQKHFTEKIVVIDSSKNDNKKDEKKYIWEKKSDVDNDIPKTTVTNSLAFALIIGNEDYSSYQKDLSTESNVQFARNDASAFKEYAINVLGIPERNITLLLDATSGQMTQALAKINLLAKAANGKAELFFYYAGHGLPDEKTQEPYLIPVDVSGKFLTNGIKLTEIYSKLTEYPHLRVTVFLDACFSGGARNQGLIEARGVKIKPKSDKISGQLIVFSAVTGEQTALPYPEKYHGFFTYFLLKKLQETKGNITYKDMTEYLITTIGMESILTINKEQTPQVNKSPMLTSTWELWKFAPIKK